MQEFCLSYYCLFYFYLYILITFHKNPICTIKGLSLLVRLECMRSLASSCQSKNVKFRSTVKKKKKKRGSFSLVIPASILLIFLCHPNICITNNAGRGYELGMAVNIC